MHGLNKGGPRSRRYRYILIILCVLLMAFCFCTYTTRYFNGGPTNGVPTKVSGSTESAMYYPPMAPSAAQADGHENITQTPCMLALHYAEQLTMSLMHFQEFLNLAWDMNMTSVEPQIYCSRMQSISNLFSKGTWLTYGRTFNASTMNQRMISLLWK